jgi:transposase
VAPPANLDDLVSELAELRRELTLLREENAKLREALQRAQRAGKRQAGPFSQGAPKNEPKTPGRKPGNDYGKKGHKKVPAKVDEVIDVPLPSTCTCGGVLVTERVAAQYQTEVPKIEPWVTRFDVHVGCCQRCGRRAQGRHPRQTSDALGAAASQLGPRAQALAVHFQKELGVSFGKAQALMRSAFGLDVTRGGLAQVVLRVADRLEPTHREIVASLPRAPVISPDETGWRVGGRSAWLWVFEAVDRVVYAVLPGRGFEDATLVLPPTYSGTWPATAGARTARMSTPSTRPASTTCSCAAASCSRSPCAAPRASPTSCACC